MTNELSTLEVDLTTIDMQTGEIIEAPEPFEVTPTGLVVNGTPTFEEWQAFGFRLQGMRSAIQWSIGDHINYGESRVEWGDKYLQALSLYDYSYEYLRNISSLAHKFAPERRYDNLSWSHHATVASLPEPKQNELLALAAPKPEEKKAAIPRDDLRDMVRKIKQNGHVHQAPVRLLSNIDFEVVEVTDSQLFVVRISDVDAHRRFTHFAADHEPRLKMTITQEAVQE